MDPLVSPSEGPTPRAPGVLLSLSLRQDMCVSTTDSPAARDCVKIASLSLDSWMHDIGVIG